MVLLGGCSDTSIVNEFDTGPSSVASQESHVSDLGPTPVAFVAAAKQIQESGDLPEPVQQEPSGLMGQASKLLSGAKEVGGQQVAETGKWLKGTWDGATDTTGSAVEGSLGWANQTFKSLKDQGLTTASSTGQWLSEDWQNMESWQYKVLAADSVPAVELEDKLNELGKQGWECFSIDDQRMIFKKASESYLRRLPFKDILRLAPLLNQGK